jgi:protein gp37
MMGTNTAIEWCHHTWNPWQGCTRVSAGCKNCYMYREKARYGQDPAAVVRSKPATFNLPLAKDKRAAYKMRPGERVFPCSWSDFFHAEADAWRPDAWDVMRRRPDLTYLIATKRIERAEECFPEDWGNGWPNVWLLASVENQEAADERVPHLLRTRAAVRGLSCEPLLGPVDLNAPLGGKYKVASMATYGAMPLRWVVCGGESGPNARPCERDWLYSIVLQCRTAGVPVFVKQLGSAYSDPVNGVAGRSLVIPEDAGALLSRRLSHPKGADMAEWPAFLRVQEFPYAEG